jgi:hypothetical protein
VAILDNGGTRSLLRTTRTSVTLPQVFSNRAIKVAVTSVDRADHHGGTARASLHGHVPKPKRPHHKKTKHHRHKRRRHH